MTSEKQYTVQDFVTESGTVLPAAMTVYAVHGELNAAGDNAVLVPSCYMADLHDADWLIGSDRALDPAELFIVTTELFGNGRASSPSTTPPPFDGPRFPVTTIRDNVEIAHRLLTAELGVTRLRAVVGFSMGAMQAFQWAVSHPAMVERIVTLCGTARSYAHGNVRLEAQIAALTTDPTFAGGDYTTPPAAGLSAFGLVWAPWLYSQRWWREELWRGTGPDRTYEDVLEEMRSDFAPGADANDLILQCRTWQQHDVGTSPGFDGDTGAALSSIRASVLSMPGSTDLYFPVDDARFEAEDINDVTLVPVPSLWGHTAGGGSDPDAIDVVTAAIREFLDVAVRHASRS